MGRPRGLRVSECGLAVHLFSGLILSPVVLVIDGLFIRMHLVANQGDAV